MAQRDGLVVPEVFTPYLVEQTTLNDKFAQSGVTRPLTELNLASIRGGDVINMPYYKANLSGTFADLEVGKSLIPSRIDGSQQKAVILHRGLAYSAADLTAITLGSENSDPMAVIGQKLGANIANEKEKDLLAVLDGVFGTVKTDSNGAALKANLVANESDTGYKDRGIDFNITAVQRAKYNLGDAANKLTTIAMHSVFYYYLQAKGLVVNSTTSSSTHETTASASSVLTDFKTNNLSAYGNVDFGSFMGLKIVVTDNLVTTEKDEQDALTSPIYLFGEGVIGTGQQAAQRVRTDTDILSMEETLAVDAHYIYHPLGTKWDGDDDDSVNPSKAKLQSAGNWKLCYDIKNIPLARINALVPSDYHNSN